jgi:hypothetical protein
MSKLDAQRAMREARYARQKAQAAGATAAPKATVRATPIAPSSTIPEPPEVAPESGERPCGHRAISGRTCTREHGHAAKSHRYS